MISGCATSRTGAVVEDRSVPETTQPPPQKQEEPAARVYKYQEPEYAEPEPLPDTVVEENQESAPQQLTFEQQSSPAVVALLDDADQYSSSGKKQEAIASIERALRIEPKNPVLWHKLGQLRLQEGNYDQAIAMAMKSNVLAVENPSLQYDNWMLIAKSREATGDKQGAAEAFNRASQLRY